MTQRSLDYFFTLQSPWSYLGHAAFMEVAQRHGVLVGWKPMNLGQVFPESGGLPLAKRHPKRRAYRDIELQRWRAKRNIPLNLRPAFWPIDIGLADRSVIVLAEGGSDPDAFVRLAFAALWHENRNLTDEETLGGLLHDAGHDATTVMEGAKSPDLTATYQTNGRDALDAGVFGAPTFVLDGEPFWGQDRIELLDDALASGRAAYQPIE